MLCRNSCASGTLRRVNEELHLKPGSGPALAFVPLILVAVVLSMCMVTPTVTGAVLYDSGNPTPDEQLVLEYINRARANPIAEGQRLGIDIHEGLTDPSLVGSRPPLAMNKLLLSIAEAHSRDMYNGNYFSHTDPNGTTAFDRITHVGYDYVRAGENMAASTSSSAAELENFMMVDSGTSGRPHRVNLLDLLNAYPCGTPPCVYYEVGIGYYAGATSNSIGSDFITEDFGAAPSAGPFLLGVVYNDVNHNNFYDIGEGIGGVSITPSSGGYYAVSSSSGGYAIPIGTSGTITVTASGPGFGPITKTVTLTAVNVKLDFTASAQVSSSSTSLQTTTPLQTSTTSSVVATSSTQTTSSSTVAASSPSIALNPTSAPAGSTVNVTGSGFSMSDTGCLISGSSVSASSCMISGGGTLKGSFVVSSVAVGSYTIAVIAGPGGDSATANFQVTFPIPSMTINPNSAEVGANVTVSGSGFAPGDSTCTITGSGGSISSPSCSISAGAVTGSFVVANVSAAVYTITVTGNQAGDSVSSDFTVEAPSTQTTSSTSSSTMTSQSSTTTVAQSTVVLVTAVVTTVMSSPTTTALRTSSLISVTAPMTLPPVPGFPLESIITGIILGLMFLAIARRRRKES